MLKDIEQVLNQCELCKQFARDNKPNKTVIPISETKPFHTWALDIVSTMPTKGKENKIFIITTIDYATRWPIAQAEIGILEKRSKDSLGKKSLANSEH